MSQSLAAVWAMNRRRPSAVVAAEPRRTLAAGYHCLASRPTCSVIVVGHDDPGLAHQAQAAQFHGADDHAAGFAGADNVIQQHGGFGDDPGDGVALVEVRGEVVRQAGQSQVGAVVGGGAQRVEAAVVFGDEGVAAGVVGRRASG